MSSTPPSALLIAAADTLIASAPGHMSSPPPSALLVAAAEAAAKVPLIAPVGIAAPAQLLQALPLASVAAPCMHDDGRMHKDWVICIPEQQAIMLMNEVNGGSILHQHHQQTLGVEEFRNFPWEAVFERMKMTMHAFCHTYLESHRAMCFFCRLRTSKKRTDLIKHVHRMGCTVVQNLPSKFVVNYPNFVHLAKSKQIVYRIGFEDAITKYGGCKYWQQQQQQPRPGALPTAIVVPHAVAISAAPGAAAIATSTTAALDSTVAAPAPVAESATAAGGGGADGAAGLKPSVTTALPVVSVVAPCPEEGPASMLVLPGIPLSSALASGTARRKKKHAALITSDTAVDDEADSCSGVASKKRRKACFVDDGGASNRKSPGEDCDENENDDGSDDGGDLHAALARLDPRRQGGGDNDDDDDEELTLEEALSRMRGFRKLYRRKNKETMKALEDVSALQGQVDTLRADLQKVRDKSGLFRNHLYRLVADLSSAASARLTVKAFTESNMVYSTYAAKAAGSAAEPASRKVSQSGATLQPGVSSSSSYMGGLYARPKGLIMATGS